MKLECFFIFDCQTCITLSLLVCYVKSVICWWGCWILDNVSKSISIISIDLVRL